MLTKGLAACIVLDPVPTAKNREMAKKVIEQSCFEVVHMGNKQADPFSISKAFAEKNPYKYKTYPNSPPSSPRLAPTPSPARSQVRQPKRATVAGNDLDYQCGIASKSINKKNVKKAVPDKNQLNADQFVSMKSIKRMKTSPPKIIKSSSKPRNLITALRDNPAVIIQVAKTLFVRTLGCKNGYHLVFASDQFIYDTLNRYIPISRVWTVKELVQALKDNEDHFKDYDKVKDMKNVRLLSMLGYGQQTLAIKKVLFDSIPNLCTYL